MASRTLPNLGLTGFFDFGEDGWDDEMSLNLLTLSVLVQGRALSKVAAEPGAPTDGDVHILDETHATQANKVAIRDDGAWVYVTPLSGWLLYNVAEGYYEKFDGATWGELVMSGGGGGVGEAPEDGTPYARQDGAWVAAPGGGGGGAWEKIGAASAGSGQIVLDGIDPDDYIELEVVLEGVAVSVAGHPALTFRTGGSDIASSVYYNGSSNSSSGSSDSANGTGTNNVPVTGSDDGTYNLDTTDAKAFSGVFRISHPGSTTNHKGFRGQGNYGYSTSNVARAVVSGVVKTLSKIEGFKLTGNVAAGTMSVYGLRRTPLAGGGGSLPFVVLSQAEYDALDPVDPDTFYFITE